MKKGDKKITRQQKIEFMQEWCGRNGFILELNGECGFGRECVGVTCNDNYPDYQWYDHKTYTRLDDNGEVWIPPNAYHKHECVAVLGRGEEAESELYDWLKWFEKNNFKKEIVRREVSNPVELLLGQGVSVRLVKIKEDGK